MIVYTDNLTYQSNISSASKHIPHHHLMRTYYHIGILCHELRPKEMMTSNSYLQTSGELSRLELYAIKIWHVNKIPTIQFWTGIPRRNSFESFELYAISDTLFFPGLFFVLFLSFLLIYVGLGVGVLRLGVGLGFWGLGYHLMGFGACGLGLQGFWGWGSVYKHRRITLGKKFASFTEHAWKVPNNALWDTC